MEVKMEKKINIPKKGAARKWAKRLKELGEQDPPEELMKKINQMDQNKKVASSVQPKKELDL